MTKNNIHPLLAPDHSAFAPDNSRLLPGSTNAVEAGSTEAMLPSSYPWHEEKDVKVRLAIKPVEEDFGYGR